MRNVSQFCLLSSSRPRIQRTFWTTFFPGGLSWARRCSVWALLAFASTACNAYFSMEIACERHVESSIASYSFTKLVVEPAAWTVFVK